MKGSNRRRVRRVRASGGQRVPDNRCRKIEGTFSFDQLSFVQLCFEVKFSSVLFGFDEANLRPVLRERS